jgi:hypothetical protein
VYQDITPSTPFYSVVQELVASTRVCIYYVLRGIRAKRLHTGSRDSPLGFSLPFTTRGLIYVQIFESILVPERW